jgi:xylose isomerase
LEERYAGWKSSEGRAILAGKRTLEEVAERVVRKKIEPQPKSGRQEYLENVVNRYV